MPDYKGLTIRFDGDASNLISTLQQIDNATERTTSMLSRINSALKLEPSNSRLYTMQTQELGRLVDSQKGRLEKLNTTLGKNKQGYKEASDNVKKYTAAVQRAQENLDAAKIAGDPQAIKKAREELGLAREGLYQATTAQQGFADKIAATNNDIELGTVKLRQLQRAHEQAEIVQRVQAGTLGELSVGLREYADGVDFIGTKLQKLGGLLTIGGLAGLFTIGRSVISETESYGNAIAQVGGYLEISGAELEHMSELALQFGKDTRYSAVEAANAISELAKGGMTQAQIEGGALDATLQLASAGNLDLARAAEVAVQAINVFKLSAEDSSMIADALAGAANRSTAEVDDLAGAFRYVSGWAGLAEYSVNDVSGALGLLADRGLQGEMAGTGLRNVMQRIAAPTEVAKKLLDEYGVEVYDAAGEMKPLVELVDELNEAFGGLEDEQRNEILNKIFGARGLPAAIALMQAGSEELGNYIDATKRMGYAEVMAEAQMGDLGWALEYLRGEFETFQVNLGSAFTPVLVEVAHAAENLLTKFNNLSKAEQQEWAKGLVEVATLGPKLLIVGTALKGFAAASRGLSVWYDFKAAFAESKEVLGDGATLMERFGRATEIASDGAVNAGKAVSILSAGLQLLGVAAAAFIAYQIWKEFEKNQERAERLNTLLERGSDLARRGAPNLRGYKNALSDLGDEAKNAADDVYELADSFISFLDRAAEEDKALESNAAQLNWAMGVIKAYGGASELTDEQVRDLGAALAVVNSELGESYALHSDTAGVIYDENDNVVNLKDSIYALIEAKKQEALVSAYTERLKEAYKFAAESGDAYRQKVDELAEAEKNLENARGRGERAKYKKEVNELTSEVETARATYVEAAAAVGVWEDRLGEATEAQMLAQEATQNALAEQVNSIEGLQAALDEAQLNVNDFTGLTAEQFNQMVEDADGNMADLAASLDAWLKERGEVKVTFNGDKKPLEDEALAAKGVVEGVPTEHTTNFYANDFVSSVASRVRSVLAGLKSAGVTTGGGNAAGGIRTHAEGGIAAYASRYHAGGSIVNVPVTGYPLDLVGEAGAEAIVPLTNRRYSQPFVDLIADGVSRRMGAGTSYNLYINGARVNDDPQIRGQFIDLMTTLARKGAMNDGNHT